MAVLFDGATLITPAVATAIDDSAMFPMANPAGNVLVLIGESAGGIPKKPVRLRSPMAAARLLRSGPLCDAAKRAFAPSAETGAPASVVVVRVDPAVQASLTLAAADDTPLLVLKSSDYGSVTNSLEVRIEDGSLRGKRVSIRQANAVYHRDNVGAEVMAFSYSGAEASAQVVVGAGTLALEAPVGTVLREYTLSDWATVSSLAEAVNSSFGTDWSVVIPDGQERVEPRHLDATDGADAQGATAKLTNHAHAVLRYFTSNPEVMIDAELVTAGYLATPKNIDWTSLTGGLNGNVETTDWEEAMASIAEIEAHWVVPLSANPAVWDLTAAHVEWASSMKRERRAFVGGSSGITAAQALLDARSLNSDRVAYVWPGIYEYDYETRETTLQPPYMAAVYVAAGFAAINPGATMSRKPISAAGTELIVREPTDTDALLDGGVLPLVQTDAGVLVSKAVSTWVTDDRYNRREVSVGAAVDYVARAVRENLASLLGERAAPEILTRARSRLESILADLSVAPPIGPGILVGDEASPSYRNIELSMDADILRVSFECSPVLPINYVLVGISVSPYSGTSVA